MAGPLDADPLLELSEARWIEITRRGFAGDSGDASADLITKLHLRKGRSGFRRRAETMGVDWSEVTGLAHIEADQAADTVGDAAREGAQHVTDDGTAAARDVKDTASSSARGDQATSPTP